MCTSQKPGSGHKTKSLTLCSHISLGEISPLYTGNNSQQRQKWPNSNCKGDAGEKISLFPPGKHRFVRSWMRLLQTASSDRASSAYEARRCWGNRNQRQLQPPESGTPALGQDGLLAALACSVLFRTCSQSCCPGDAPPASSHLLAKGWKNAFGEK